MYFCYRLPHTTTQRALTSRLPGALHPDARFARSGFTRFTYKSLGLNSRGGYTSPLLPPFALSANSAAAYRKILLSAGCTCQTVQAPAPASAREAWTQKPPGLVGGLAVGPQQSCPAGDPGCGAVLTPSAPPGCVLGGADPRWMCSGGGREAAAPSLRPTAARCWPLSRALPTPEVIGHAACQETLGSVEAALPKPLRHFQRAFNGEPRGRAGEALRACPRCEHRL